MPVIFSYGLIESSFADVGKIVDRYVACLMLSHQYSMGNLYAERIACADALMVAQFLSHFPLRLWVYGCALQYFIPYFPKISWICRVRNKCVASDFKLASDVGICLHSVCICDLGYPLRHQSRCDSMTAGTSCSVFMPYILLSLLYVQTNMKA